MKFPDDGLSVSDVFDATFVPVSGEDFAWARTAIAANYGIAVIDFKDKFELVKQQASEMGWSGARFRDAVKNLIRTQRFSAWTTADILGYRSDVKLKPYHKGNLPVGPADIYKIDGRYFWKESDSVELPFEKVKIEKPEALKQEVSDKADPERIARMLKVVESKLKV